MYVLCIVYIFVYLLCNCLFISIEANLFLYITNSFNYFESHVLPTLWLFMTREMCTES